MLVIQKAVRANIAERKEVRTVKYLAKLIWRLRYWWLDRKQPARVLIAGVRKQKTWTEYFAQGGQW